MCIPFSMLFSYFPLCFASLQFKVNVTFFCNPAVVIRTMLTLETGHSFNSLMLGFRYSTAQKQSGFTICKAQKKLGHGLTDEIAAMNSWSHSFELTAGFSFLTIMYTQKRA